MIRERHTEASSVVLKSLKLERDPKSSFQDIFVDALYIGRVPTIDDPEGRQRILIKPVNLFG